VAAGVTRALLDTSVVIGQTGDADRLPPTAAISVVTIGELHAGILLARSARVRRLRRQRLDAILAAFEPIPVDEPVAERYGELVAVARRGRRAAKASDLLVIAAAAATSRLLYTLDAAQARLARDAGVDVVLH
jgi:toxin FitB